MCGFCSCTLWVFVSVFAELCCAAQNNEAMQVLAKVGGCVVFVRALCGCVRLCMLSCAAQHNIATPQPMCVCVWVGGFGGGGLGVWVWVWVWVCVGVCVCVRLMCIYWVFISVCAGLHNKASQLLAKVDFWVRLCVHPA